MSGVYSRWKFVADIAVQNPSGADGCQVQTTIPWKPGMTGDFRDLRFASIHGNPLPYWIESHTEYSSATVWIALPAGDKKIRMYYGNGTAKGESEGQSVFDFFDDFENIDQWEDRTDSSGAATVNGNTLELYVSGANTNTAVRTKENVLTDETITEITVVRHDGVLYGPASRIDPPWYGAQGSDVEFSGIYGDSTGNWGYRRGSSKYDMGTRPADPYIMTIIRHNGQVSTGDDTGQSTGFTSLHSSLAGYPNQLVLFARGISDDPSGHIHISDVRVRKYATTQPTLSIIRTKPNPDFFQGYVEPPAQDILNIDTGVTTNTTVLIDRLEFGNLLNVDANLSSFTGKVPITTITSVISQDNFIDKLDLDMYCDALPLVGGIRVFADLNQYNIENVSISKTINDTMWQLTATVDGVYAPAEFRHLNFSRADVNGINRHLFTGIIPDTRFTLKVAKNKIQLTAFDYGWFLSAQYVPSGMQVMNLDGDKSSWHEWIEALLDETGISAYRMENCTEVPDKEFVFDNKTTKREAIEQITKATGFIFAVKWIPAGNTYVPAAYFIASSAIDDPDNGIDLPDPVTSTWPDPTLVDIPVLQGVVDEKINRVKVRGVDSSGNWYSATVESMAVTNNEDLPREYYFESADLNTQDKVNAKSAELYAYFSSDTYTVEATFTGRYDLQLYQKIRFTGEGFPAKLTDLGWLRIISISYDSSCADDTVKIKAVVDRDVSLQQTEINRYLIDNVSENELLVNSKLDTLKTTPLVGTVQSIDGNVATILTEDGKTIKARIVHD
jgi:hypothetical protein